MRLKEYHWLLPLSAFFVLAFPYDSPALTAKELLELTVKQNFAESFRVALAVTTSKGKKVTSKHSLWLVGKSQAAGQSFFVEVDEPKESKGVRFLFQFQPGKETGAFMYLPASDKTLPLAVDDPSGEIGGTGLTMDDLQALVPQAAGEATLENDDKVDGTSCHVVKITLPKGQGSRRLWIAKDDMVVIKAEQSGADGKVKRKFKVVEFFKTEQGKKFPREEEITLPERGLQIRVRQEHAVFGIEVQEELTDPKAFGRYRWKI
ncbi:MAG: outer membrane lipoprotein-sorting protein [Pseudomonadota bacterium]